jgi:diguanylate cyclase (GGDEF)-like protein
VLARWGGEEFLLVMPDTSIAAAQVVLDRLRAHIAQEATWVDCPLGRVTFSAGVTLQLQGQSLDVTAHRADGALYEAKRRGRDRVVTAIGATFCPPCSGSAILAPVGSNAVAEDLAPDAGSEH